jgi:YebC/PmpR family DNA-binding regulatory protein
MGRAHEVRAASMAKTAAAKSKLYSIYAKEIYKAAKSNPDPVNNLELKRIIEKAKKEQVPADVITRNIDKVKKGIVEDYEVCEYEAFGPGGSNLIIRCLTDNINRSLSLIKTVFNKTGLKLASMGAVSYMYEHLAVLGIKDASEEEVMEAMFNEGIDLNDIEVDGDLLLIYGEPQDFYRMKKVIEDNFKNSKIEIEEISKYAKDTIKLEGEDLEKFKRALDMLDEIDDVSNVYHNVEL